MSASATNSVGLAYINQKIHVHARETSRFFEKGKSENDSPEKNQENAIGDGLETTVNEAGKETGGNDSQ